MRKARIVVATPHERYDALVRALAHDGTLDVLRMRDRDELSADRLSAVRPDYVFLPHWSWRIPRDVHEQFECVVFHMTDLPYGRGGSPLQNLIVSGAEQTKLTALKCVEELDAGPVYLKADLSTLGTAEEVFVRAAELMKEMIRQIARGGLTPTVQSGEVVRFERRRAEQGNMADLHSLKQVHDAIRMLDADGYPKAFLETGKLRLEFTRASLKPGYVTADVRIELRDGSEPEK